MNRKVLWTRAIPGYIVEGIEWAQYGEVQYYSLLVRKPNDSEHAQVKYSPTYWDKFVHSEKLQEAVNILAKTLEERATSHA